jgi:hypothetical protein
MAPGGSNLPVGPDKGRGTSLVTELVTQLAATACSGAEWDETNARLCPDGTAQEHTRRNQAHTASWASNPVADAGPSDNPNMSKLAGIGLGVLLVFLGCSSGDRSTPSSPSPRGTSVASPAPTSGGGTRTSSGTPPYPIEHLNPTERLVLERLAREGGNPQLNELGGINNADVRMALGTDPDVFVRVVESGTPGDALRTQAFGKVTTEVRRTTAFGDLYSFECTLPPLGSKTVEVAFTASPDVAVPAVYELLQCEKGG